MVTARKRAAIIVALLTALVLAFTSLAPASQREALGTGDAPANLVAKAEAGRADASSPASQTAALGAGDAPEGPAAIADVGLLDAIGPEKAHAATVYAAARKAPRGYRAIVYHLNGGTQPAHQRYAVKNGRTIPVSKLKKPTRRGYRFVGWFSTSKLNKKAKTISGTRAKSARTLYAKWKPKKYKIAYKLRGGTLSSSARRTYKTIRAAKLPTPKRFGYAFEGWYTKPGGTKRVSVIPKGSIGTKTFYAKWRLLVYRVRFNPNGGTFNEPVPKRYLTRDGLKPLPKPHRSGYSFIGWYSDSRLRHHVRSIAPGTRRAKVYYARWEKRVVIGHRGYRKGTPANSIQAFRAAHEKGFTWVETDVRFTKDDVPVLSHDATVPVRKTVTKKVDTGKVDEKGKPIMTKKTMVVTVNTRISRMTLEELQTATLEGWKHGLPKNGVRKNRLEFREFMRECKEMGLKVNIDMKEQSRTKIRWLYNIAVKYGMKNNVRWLASSPTTVSYILHLHPHAKILYLRHPSETVLEYLSGLQARGVDVQVQMRNTQVQKRHAARCAKWGIPLSVWGFADETTLRSMSRYISSFTINYLSGESVPKL